MAASKSHFRRDLELPKAHYEMIGRITVLFSELESELFQLTMTAVRHNDLIKYLTDQNRDMDRAFDLAFWALMQEGTLAHAERLEATRTTFNALRAFRNRCAHGLWRHDKDRREVTVSASHPRILRGLTRKRGRHAAVAVDSEADIITVGEAELAAVVVETLSLLIEVVAIRESLAEVKDA